MFDKWSADGDPLQVYDLRRDDAVTLLHEFYGDSQNTPLLEVLNHAYRLRAQTVVVETRYIDIDWRDEHSRYWSTTFSRYPSAAHRLHFFEQPIPVEAASGEIPDAFSGRGYLGYVVLRPVKAASVGRTMLVPSSDLLERTPVVALARDRVNLMGTDLEVVAAPFYSQDAQLSRCAQATMLMTSYHHHRTFGGARYRPTQIADAVSGAASELGRALPSPGLNIGQIAAASAAIGLPPDVQSVDRLIAAGDDVKATICRYLNSRLPVTVATPGHAFVLIGYDRKPNPDGGTEIRFLRQDDEVGPYQWVEDWREDIYGPWQYIIVPLPPKVYLTGEPAERIGEKTIKEQLAQHHGGDDTRLDERLATGTDLGWRSTVLPSNDFKRSCSPRGLPDPVAAAYQFTNLPRYVWVVELIDRTLRDQHRPCVLAEAVIDATSNERDLQSAPLAWRTPSRLTTFKPDYGKRIADPALRHAEPIVSLVDGYAPHARPTAAAVDRRRMLSQPVSPTGV